MKRIKRLRACPECEGRKLQYQIARIRLLYGRGVAATARMRRQFEKECSACKTCKGARYVPAFGEG